MAVAIINYKPVSFVKFSRKPKATIRNFSLASYLDRRLSLRTPKRAMIPSFSSISLLAFSEIYSIN